MALMALHQFLVQVMEAVVLKVSGPLALRTCRHFPLSSL